MFSSLRRIDKVIGGAVERLLDFLAVVIIELNKVVRHVADAVNPLYLWRDGAAAAGGGFKYPAVLRTFMQGCNKLADIDCAAPVIFPFRLRLCACGQV